MANSENWIKQIQAGEVTYDIAVQHGITFKQGNDDATGTPWDGTSDLTVVIPTLSDIVSSPVIFVGTVTGGTISYASGYGPNAQKGYLVYIQNDCTFNSTACEAGDMAVYDGTAWKVIQGENQVAIVGVDTTTNSADVLLTGTLAEVLTVEGKSLKLAIDYSDFLGHMSVTKNTQTSINVGNGKVNVAPKYIGLSQGSGSTENIAVAVSFALPSALADGSVAISQSVLTSGDFTFSAGAFPTISKNASALNVTASHAMSIGKANGTDGANGDYVTSVEAINGVSLIAGTSTGNDLTYVASLSATTGTNFVTGIKTHTSDDPEADLVIPGSVSIASANNTFIDGLGAEAASGDLVSSISVGAVTGTFLTGLSGDATKVVTSVTIGSVEKDTSASWFVDGLTTGTDVVTGVSVGAVSLVAGNTFASSAMVSASVSGHVLSFTTGSFMTPVVISQAATTVDKSGFSKAGVKLSGWDATDTTFTTASVAQASTTISYRSLTSKAVTLTQGQGQEFNFTKAADHAYQEVLGYALISTTGATVTKNTPVLANTGINVTIPADTVAVGLNAGTLPSLTISDPTGTLTGSVDTALTSAEFSFLGVSSAASTINIPGACTLEVVASDANGAVEVAAASSQYSLTGATVTIAADTFVTDVQVGGSNLSPLSA